MIIMLTNLSFFGKIIHAMSYWIIIVLSSDFHNAVHIVPHFKLISLVFIGCFGLILK